MRITKLLACTVLAACIAGCAGTSALESSTTSASTIPGGTQPQPPATPSSLAVGTASADEVQSQPPAGSCHARGAGRFALPDPRCTPGAISPDVTQANIQSTICQSGYTRTVRPRTSVTEPEKSASLAAYGDSGPRHEFEYDHLVSLELGGASNDPRNLWPEPGGVPNPKDTLENRLHTLVCGGQLSLADAQREIASDWVLAYQRIVR